MSKDKLTQLFVILAVLAVLGVAGYFGWKAIRIALNNDDSKSITELSSVTGADVVTGEEQVYTHPDYGFTLRYPGNLKLGKFPEGEGEIILLQGSSGGSAQTHEGFQIFITPYNETEEFSKEVILKADSTMKIENDKFISLGAEEIVALIFDSSNESAPTHEVWFVADGNLYQATSFKQYGGEMEEILGSLSFN